MSLLLLDSLLHPEFSQIIQRRMIEKRMTPAVLAKKSKVSRATVYNILRGARVTDRVLMAIARVLDLNMRDLLKQEPLISKVERR